MAPIFIEFCLGLILPEYSILPATYIFLILVSLFEIKQSHPILVQRCANTSTICTLFFSYNPNKTLRSSPVLLQNPRIGSICTRVRGESGDTNTPKKQKIEY